jgi:hypothetical protein
MQGFELLYFRVFFFGGGDKGLYSARRNNPGSFIKGYLSGNSTRARRYHDRGGGRGGEWLGLNLLFNVLLYTLSFLNRGLSHRG